MARRLASKEQAYGQSAISSSDKDLVFVIGRLVIGPIKIRDGPLKCSPLEPHTLQAMFLTRLVLPLLPLATTLCSSADVLEVGPCTFRRQYLLTNGGVCLDEVMKEAAGYGLTMGRRCLIDWSVALPEGFPRAGEPMNDGIAIAVGILKGLEEVKHSPQLEVSFNDVISEIRKEVETLNAGKDPNQRYAYSKAVALFSVALKEQFDVKIIRKVIRNVVPRIIMQRTTRCPERDTTCPSRLEDLMYKLGSHLNLNGYLRPHSGAYISSSLAELSVKAVFEEVLKRQGYAGTELLSLNNDLKKGLPEMVKLTQDVMKEYADKYGISMVKIDETKGALGVLEAWHHFGLLVPADECAQLANRIAKLFEIDMNFERDDSLAEPVKHPALQAELSEVATGSEPAEITETRDPVPQAELNVASTSSSESSGSGLVRAVTSPNARDRALQVQPQSTSSNQHSDPVRRSKTHSMPEEPRTTAKTQNPVITRQPEQGDSKVKQTEESAKSKFKIKSPISIILLAIVVVAVLATAVILPIYFGR